MPGFKEIALFICTPPPDKYYLLYNAFQARLAILLPLEMEMHAN